MQKVTSLINTLDAILQKKGNGKNYLNMHHKEAMEIFNYLFDASELNIEIRNKQITQKQKLNADLNEQNQLELAF